MVNTIVTSKEEILRISRELIRAQGWSAVNIRSVAAACGVSVGSIYNYFDSKADLIGAAVESVWCDIFHRPEEDVFCNIEQCICWLYQRMEYGGKQYPGFFTLHSVSFIHSEKQDGRKKMQQTWQHIQESLCIVLKRDPNLRPNAFDEHFSAEQFAEILFSLILSSLIKQEYDPSAVLEMIRRTIY